MDFIEIKGVLDHEDLSKLNLRTGDVELVTLDRDDSPEYLALWVGGGKKIRVLGKFLKDATGNIVALQMGKAPASE